jgi:hypothetical protein
MSNEKLTTEKIPEGDFAGDVVMELLKTAVKDNIGAAPSRIEAEGAVFQEVLSRIDFENRKVRVSDFDVGEVGEGCLSLASLAIKFGIFLAWKGVELTHEGYFQRSDH